MRRKVENSARGAEKDVGARRWRNYLISWRGKRTKGERYAGRRNLCQMITGSGSD